MFQSSRRWQADGLSVLAAVLPFTAAWIYFVWMVGDERARWVYAGAKAVQFSLPFAWLWATGNPVRWPSPPSRRHWLWGLLSGLAMAAGILGWYRWALGGSALESEARARIVETLFNFRVEGPLAYLGMSIGLSLLHSLLEEYYWRGFVFDRFSAWVPPPLAITLSSLAFASHHLLVVRRYLPEGSLLSLALPATLTVAAGGAFWCWLYRRSGSLLPSWISHVLVDAALMLVGWQLTRSALAGPLP